MESTTLRLASHKLELFLETKEIRPIPEAIEQARTTLAAFGDLARLPIREINIDPTKSACSKSEFRLVLINRRGQTLGDVFIQPAGLTIRVGGHSIW